MVQIVRMKQRFIVTDRTFLDSVTLHVAFRNHVRLKNAEFSSNQVSSEASVNEKVNIFSLYTF